MTSLHQPTRITETALDGQIEWASVNSVELTNTVKDGLRVSSVKVYDSDPVRAAERAVECYIHAAALVAKARETEPQS